MTSLLASHHQVWVGTDEWTDTQGHAIVNILLGCSDKVFFFVKVPPIPYFTCTGVCDRHSTAAVQGSQFGCGAQ